METIKVQVQPQHVENGKKCDGETCAFAIALKEAKPGLSDIFVGYTNTEFYFENQRWMCQHPKHLREQIKKFDEEKQFALGEYTLEPILYDEETYFEWSDAVLYEDDDD